MSNNIYMISEDEKTLHSKEEKALFMAHIMKNAQLWGRYSLTHMRGKAYPQVSISGLLLNLYYIQLPSQSPCLTRRTPDKLGFADDL